VGDVRTGAALGARLLVTTQQKRKAVEGAFWLVARRFPAGEHENRARREALLPHTSAVLQHALELDSCIKDSTVLDNFG
jgi:hypothetical protein